MLNKEYDQKVRPTLRCVSISEPVWQLLTTLAEKAGETKSSYLRYLIKSRFKKERGERTSLSWIKAKTPLG